MTFPAFTVEEVPDKPGLPSTVEYPTTSDGKGICPDCGKSCSINRDGTLRSHKCVNEVGSARSASSRAKSHAKAPDSVHVITTALIAGGVEWGAAHALARSIPTDYATARRASDMGNNADDLVKPIVNAIWPELPKGTQKLLLRIADHSDLIACLFAWSDYVAELRSFAQSERERQAADTTPTTGGADHGYQGPLDIPGPGFEPFRPAADG